MDSQHDAARVVWQREALGLVQEILRQARPEHVDGLLDLWGALKVGGDWARVMDHFLACRRAMEHEHYLPFYRLRRLLGHWLALEWRSEQDAEVRANLRRLLRWKFTSWAQLSAALARERFEHEHVGGSEVPLDGVSASCASANIL